MTTSPLSTTLSSLAPAIANHLWQSTAFALGIWLLTLLLRRNSASIRHALWLTASVKFLVPISLLTGLGSYLPAPRQNTPAPRIAIYSAVDIATQPFLEIAPPTSTRVSPIPTLMAATWLSGTLLVLLIWSLRWRRAADLLHHARPMQSGRERDILHRLQSPVRVSLHHSHHMLEPALFGIVRPTLLWPAQLSQHLSDEHIEAILTHELAHARRRDNLTAALHMLVEAIFWFNPIVWWIETRMLNQRELACDEAVVRSGSRPEAYAESLLQACRFSIESPLPCVSGITGADLAQRILTIMSASASRRMTLGRRLILAAAATCAIAAPLLFGQVSRSLHMPMFIASPTPPPPPPPPPNYRSPTTLLPIFDVVSVKPAKDTCTSSEYSYLPDGIRIVCVPLRMILQEAYAIHEQDRITAPDWTSNERYTIEARVDQADLATYATLSRDQRLLMLQALLADRFQLRLHHQTRDLPVYALVVARGGPHLKPSAAGESKPMMRLKGRTEIEAQASTFEFMLRLISPTAGRPIIDRTGLTGTYDFTLKWSLPDATRTDTDAPDLFTALQEQLGLKLDPQRAPLDTLVVDHIEPPTAD